MKEIVQRRTISAGSSSADRTQQDPETLPTSSWLSCIFPYTPLNRFQPKVIFTVREGLLIVGYGIIQSRGMESFPTPVARVRRVRWMTEVDINFRMPVIQEPHVG